MKENRMPIQKRIDLLTKDMGKSTFLKLLHFVVEVMESDYEIKIFMIRRFLDIFLEFEEIVPYLYGDTVNKRGVFVTNLSIVTLREQLANKTILVVDDIRLHGRALNEMTAFLVEQCNCLQENIVLKVFADNENAIKVKSRFQNKLEIKESINENRWRKISSSIINSFYILGQPYVSYLPYCELAFGTKEADAIKEFIQNSKVKEITTDIQKYYDVHVFLYFMKDDCGKDKELKTSLVEQNMIRIYIYDKLEKIIIVPYAFLKPLSFDGILSYYKLLRNLEVIQGEDITKTIGAPATIETNEYLTKYLYSLETYITSQVFGKKFLIDRQICNVSWNKEIEKYNFANEFNIDGINIDSFIERLAIKEIGKYADYSDTNLQLDKEKKIDKLVEKIKGGNIQTTSIDRFIESYIKLSGREDEELAEQGEKRMRGIEYLRLCQYFSKENAEKIWETIVKVIDSGRGTLSVCKNNINGKIFMDSLLFAGEQNFACNEPNLIYFIYPLLEYECFCRNNEGLKAGCEEDTIKGKIDLINYILNNFPELREKVDDFEIESLKGKSVLQSGMDYYMSRYSIYEKDEKLKQILEKTKHYEEG